MCISIFSIVTVASLVSSLVSAQSTNYYSIAETAALTLNSFYKSDIGLWDGSIGWWNSANCLTTLTNLALADGNVVNNVTSQLANTFEQAQKQDPNKGSYKKRSAHATLPPQARSVLETRSSPNKFLNDYYDDEGWWALAWIAAYDLTHNETYLDAAATIFLDMTAGWPTSCNNGGVWWNKSHDQVNAIANELFISVAASLANRDTSNKQAWVNWATQAWQWFEGTGLINSQSLINDKLSNCQNDGTQPIWTYNQGVILGALVELSQATGNSSLIPQAQAIAGAAVAKFADSNHVLHEPQCESSGCDNTSNQFKGIFVRNLAKLDKVAPNDAYKQVIQSSADSVWAIRDSQGEMPGNWAGSFQGSANAVTQSSALDAIVGTIEVLGSQAS